MNILSLWVAGKSYLHSLYGHRDWWPVFSGFVPDEKNTRFNVVAALMGALLKKVSRFQRLPTRKKEKGTALEIKTVSWIYTIQDKSSTNLREREATISS